MKRVLCLVADIRELSSDVIKFLGDHDVDILCIGIGRDNVVRVLSDLDLSVYDEVWNVGSVGSKLPLYSVFEVGSVYSKENTYKTKLSDSRYLIKTTDGFATGSSGVSDGFDMELDYIVNFIKRNFSFNFSRPVVRAFKYVSDNLSGEFSIDDWYKSIDETASIVSRPLIKLLSNYLV